MKSEMNQLNDEIVKAEDRLKALNAEIDSLKTSREKIERVAREKFDMMKKNEKVFKIEEK
jgi:cell division protein FtsB